LNVAGSGKVTGDFSDEELNTFMVFDDPNPWLSKIRWRD
jgi:hypothetical protein